MNRRCVCSLLAAVAALGSFSAGLASVGRLEAAVPAAHIYWMADGTKFLRADLDGTNQAIAVSNTNGNTADFVIDHRTSQIYWNSGFSIYRSNLDGSATTDLYDLGQNTFPGDIGIDPVTNQLFFIDGRNNAIYRSNLDGTAVTTVVPAHGSPTNADGQGASDLWIDSNAGKVYWNDTDAIHRMNLDGSQDQVLFTGAAGISDFEVDPQHGKIYWAATSGIQGAGAIRRANLDGTQQQTLVTGLWWADGIALDLPDGKMYYTDAWYAGPTNYNGTIRMANLDGTGQQVLINVGSSVLDRPREITLDTAVVPEPGVIGLMFGFLAAMCFGGSRKRWL